MQYITFVEIENFKGFKDKIHIDLKHPSVLIGPNNAGKTTVIQALSLWSRAVNTWYEKKGGKRSKNKKMERYGVGINRLDILDIPVKESRYYWNGTRVRTENTPISFFITVGILHKGQEYPFKMLFNSRDQESIYCRPDNDIINNEELFSTARSLLFNLLYPMSGIAAGTSFATEEFLANEGQIRVLMGQGRTAAVLRNLCYQVFSKNPQDWGTLCATIKSIFNVDILNPILIESRGILTLTYSQPGIENPLDIAMSGRGMQQILLILAYLYSHQNSILMIDEPDAHLEILRQKQVFSILKNVAESTKCQIIIATHSEVILDEAVDTNLSFLINGTASNIATNTDIKNMLKTIGVEHYYKACVSPRLLIVEGSTDTDMLAAFAEKLNHKALDFFKKNYFSYYTQDEDASAPLVELANLARPGNSFKQYFYTLKHLVPTLRGLAIFDSDNNTKTDDPSTDLGVFYWHRYELENYFISPEILLRYIDKQYEEDNLFSSEEHRLMKEAVDQNLANYFFDGDMSKVSGYYEATQDIRQNLLRKIKMSEFAERVFALYSQKIDQPLLMNKGDFYKIIAFLAVDEVPVEITEKLDLIVQYLL